MTINNEEMIPKPELYFLPKDQSIIRTQLNDFLDSAQSNVRIAVYTLTDQDLVNKLSQLGNNNIAIELVIDEATLEKAPSDMIDQLQSNNIKILVAPEAYGIMHHKYVVIDQKAVWTGSANFSKTVLNPKKDWLNDENIIILHSPSIATDYIDNFKNLKEELEDSYINIITTPDLIKPRWLKKISQQLYKMDDGFKKKVTEYKNNTSHTKAQKKYLENYLKSVPIRGRRPRSSDSDSDGYEPSSQSTRSRSWQTSDTNQSRASSSRNWQDNSQPWYEIYSSDSDVDLQGGGTWDIMDFEEE